MVMSVCLFAPSPENLMDIFYTALYCAHNIKDEFKRHSIFHWLSLMIYRCYYKISIFFSFLSYNHTSSLCLIVVSLRCRKARNTLCKWTKLFFFDEFVDISCFEEKKENIYKCPFDMIFPRAGRENEDFWNDVELCADSMSNKNSPLCRLRATRAPKVFEKLY